MSHRTSIPKVDVLGVHVGVLSPDALVDEVRSMVNEDVHRYVTFTGVHGVMESRRDSSLKAIYNSAAVVAPDGMPLVWAGRHVGLHGGQRCYGPDCMLLLCELAEQEGWPIYLYGGRPGVGDALAKSLSEMFPGIEIAGTHCPPFRDLTPDEIESEVTAINDSGARLVFVGISTPKQDRWMAERVGKLQANVLFGVGAAFDFHTGLVRQAPKWMKVSGLEWLFRLCMEPRRLFVRYSRVVPGFVFHILRQPPRAIAK